MLALFIIAMLGIITFIICAAPLLYQAEAIGSPGFAPAYVVTVIFAFVAGRYLLRAIPEPRPSVV